MYKHEKERDKSSKLVLKHIHKLNLEMIHKAHVLQGLKEEPIEDGSFRNQHLFSDTDIAQRKQSVSRNNLTEEDREREIRDESNNGGLNF